MSDFPRFNEDVFGRGDSPERSPLSSPLLLPSEGFPTFPRRSSMLRFSESYDDAPSPPPSYVSSFAKRGSAVGLLSEKDRKPSVALYHGDLNEEPFKRRNRKSRRRTFVWWILITLLIGLFAGAAIGYWLIPLLSALIHGAPKCDASSSSGTVANTPPSDVPDSYSPDVPGDASDPTFTDLPDSRQKISTSAAISVPTGVSGSFWQPTAGTTFQIQLSSVISSTSNLPANIAVYDTDLFDTPASTIAALKAAGKKVICYFSAGSAENWRSDYSQFAAADLGKGLDGWAGEKWIYTPSSNVRKIMVARLQLAKSKGCDGVDPDNLDVYGIGSDSGFNDLTKATAVDFVIYLANQAHALGLAMGLKNAGEIIPQVLPYVQWVISEQCVNYKECSLYQPFINANKPAFNIQYPFGGNSKSTSVSDSAKTKFCTSGGANIKGFTNVLKHMNLDNWLMQC